MARLVLAEFSAQYTAIGPSSRVVRLRLKGNLIIYLFIYSVAKL